MNGNERDLKLAEDIMSKHKSSADQKKFYEMDVLLNLRYLKGNTYHSADGMHRIYKEYASYMEGTPIHKEHYNVIDSVRREYVARLTRTFPLIRCEPKTQDYATRTKALITNKIMENFERDSKMEQKFRLFCDGLVDTGTCGFLPYWDNTAGEIETVEHFQDEVNGEKFDNIKIKRAGEVGIDLVYFWEMFPDSVKNNSLNDCRWFIRARAFTIQEIEDTYGKKINAESVNKTTKQTSYNSSGMYETTGITPNDEAVLYEYYERPSSRFPNGRYVVVCNNQVLLNNNRLPYNVGANDKVDFGIIIGKFISRPKEFFGDTIISPSRAVQRNVDATENLKRRFMANITVDKWVYEEGAIDDPNDLDLDGSNKIKLNFGRRAPEQLRSNGMDGQIFQHANSVMDLNSYVSGVSRFALTGNANSAQRSSGVFEKMNNRDNTSFSGTITNIELVMLETYSIVLKLYKLYAKDRRWIDKYDKYFNMIEFKFGDVLEELTLTNKGLIGLTEDEERQMIGGLVNNGFFNRDEESAMDAQTKQSLLNQMKLGQISDFVDDPFVNQMRAQEREYEDLIKGKKVGINPYDNHQAHISAMEKMLTSPEFYELKMGKNGESIYKYCINHYNEHKEELDKMVKSQLIQQQLLEGKQ